MLKNLSFSKTFQVLENCTINFHNFPKPLWTLTNSINAKNLSLSVLVQYFTNKECSKNFLRHMCNGFQFNIIVSLTYMN